MVRFSYLKLWSDVNKWFESLECAIGSSHLVPSSELSEWFVQDLANSILIKLRQSAECESLIEASRLGILKINPDMYWLSNLCRHYVLMFIGSTEPHHYFIDYFVYSNSFFVIKINFYVSHCFSVFALKLSILSIILIIRYNQIVFQIYFPLTYPLFTHFHLQIHFPFISIIKSIFIFHSLPIYFPLYFPLSFPIVYQFFISN